MDKKLLVNLGLDVIMVGCSFACGACVASYVNMKKFKKHLEKNSQYDKEIYNGLMEMKEVLDNHDCEQKDEEC